VTTAVAIMPFELKSNFSSVNENEKERKFRNIKNKFYICIGGKGRSSLYVLHVQVKTMIMNETLLLAIL
jgi:hypothetical protein